MLKVNCQTCGNEFNTYPSWLKGGKGKNCSVVCANKSFKGKHFSPNTEIKLGQVIDPRVRGYTYTKARKSGRTYKLIYKPDHPYASSRGYVREHRLVMEQHVGRYLRPDEVVDHINMDTLNNDISNLRLMSKREHDRMNVWLNVHRRWYEREGTYAKRMEAISKTRSSPKSVD